MARSFLPPPSPGTSYPVQPANGRFAEGDARLLSHVGANMAVSEAQTEGRVPSPLSRAYMFFTALSGVSLAMTGNQDDLDDAGRLAAEGRRVLRERARATFRGIAAVFALRDALGLTIELKSVPLVQAADPVARVLGPNLNGAPGGAAYWQHVRLFTVRAGKGAPEVLGGLSPLTSFFPAANPPAHALAGVFWYAPPDRQSPTGRWNDPTGPTPTGGTTPLSPTTQAVVRAALAAWVRSVRTDFRDDDLLRQGVDAQGVALIRGELDAWAAELAAAPSIEGVGVAAGTIARPTGQEVPPFLEATCVGVGGAVLSDLPLHAGRLVVSSRALADPTKRIWGAVFGAGELGDRAKALAGTGDNLGASLGLGDSAAPVPFMILDKLFAPRFTILTQSGVADEWRALAVENHGSTEYALFPFSPDLLQLLSPDELSDATTARMSSDHLNYVVQLEVGGQQVTQLYATSGQGDYALDLEVSADTVDVRLFPNFDLDAVRAVLPTDASGAQPDARYYARVRLGPDWTFGVRALHVDQGADGLRTASTTAAADRRGSKTAASAGAAAPGEADFFTLDRRPDGFVFEGRGLCLVDLPRPDAADLNPQSWDVSVDFGTSNSCVAFRPSDGSRPPAPFPFPVMTTTLLRRPIYGAMGNVNEGHSAVADFFFKLSADDQDLVSPPQYPDAATPYFPTQIVTLQTELPGGASDFDLSAGLILFQNGILSGVGLLEILNGFDLQTDSRRLTKRFHLQQDIKWTRRTWLRAFMAHLRLQVVLTAARQNARVETVLFSYPKAFNDQEEQAYETALRATWGTLFGGLLSESEAVRTTLGGTANQHVVLDVGGGTTDVIGFNGGVPSFQTSFKLASGQVNEYVVGSPAFRAAFRQAVMNAEIDSLAAGQGGLTLRMFEDGTATQLLNVWVGLLQSIEYADASGLALTSVTSALAEAARGDDDQARAVRGFFLTTTVLFGGLAYSAGRLLRLASDGKIGDGAFPLTSVRIALTGNGSKLINLLSSSRQPFDRVFKDLFRRGLAGGASTVGGDGAPHPAETVRIEFDGVYTLADGSPAPKATVALGLLDGGIKPAEREVPVANVVLEDAGASEAEDSLVAFYGRVVREPGAFVPGRQAPPELAAFLDALGEALPNGHNGKRMVIPGVGPGWHEPLKTETFAEATGALLDRLADNAGDLPAGAETAAGAAYVPALEPVLIAEIAALLEQVAEDHQSGRA